MPYPLAHILFSVFCISAIVVYTTVRPFLSRKLSFRDLMRILFLLAVGSFFALFPDIMVVYNLLVNGTLDHCTIGSIPTHSLLFSSSAILLGTLAGYVAYRDFSRAIYLGIFAEAGFLSHLLLDDIGEGGCKYLYPVYNQNISVFSIMDVGFDVGLFNYLIASFVSVFFIFSVIMMVLLALSQFGFEFIYRSKK